MPQLCRQSSQRILIAAKYFSENYGGTPESILLLARILASIGVATDVVTPNGFVPDAHLLAALPEFGASGAYGEGLDIRAYGGLFIAGPWNPQAVKLAFRARRTDIPVSYAPKAGLARADFNRLRDIKKIPYFLLVEVFLLLWSHAVIFSSAAERDNCAVPGFLWKRKQVILPEPFLPLEHTGVPPSRPASGPVLGFLAEIRSLKGLRELVDAVALLAMRPGAENVRLRIAGDSRPGSEKYLADIYALADRLGLSGRLEWLGGVRGDQNRSDFYESLDIFVCPSKSESFGLTPLEALWHGVPVVMGPNIGVRDYIPPDAPVAIFGEAAPEEIAFALHGLMSEGESLGRRARAWRGRRMPSLTGEALATRFHDVFIARDTGKFP